MMGQGNDGCEDFSEIVNIFKAPAETESKNPPQD
jgi:hypothetical protein